MLVFSTTRFLSQVYCKKNIAKTWLFFKIIGDILAYIGYTITVTTIYVVFLCIQ